MSKDQHLLTQPQLLATVVLPAPSPGGRPTIYSAELGLKVCEHVGDDKTLREIAAMDDMPCKTTIMAWVGERPDFARMYRFALEARFDEWADQMRKIAAGEPGPIAEEDENKANPNSETTDKVSIAMVKQTIQRARLEIETMKWIMGKRLPRYAEESKVVVEQKGEATAGPPPVQIVPLAGILEERRKAAAK